MPSWTYSAEGEVGQVGDTVSVCNIWDKGFGPLLSLLMRGKQIKLKKAELLLAVRLLFPVTFTTKMVSEKLDDNVQLKTSELPLTQYHTKASEESGRFPLKIKTKILKSKTFQRNKC